MNIRFYFNIFLCAVTLTSCVTDYSFTSKSYDSRKILIQSLSLFNQKNIPFEENLNWNGDWIFRRERLNLIDFELRTAKPDLLILQEVMRKNESPHDSDQAILSAGSLIGYDWQVIENNYYEDSHEVESLAIVTSTPVISEQFNKNKMKIWHMGENNYLGAFITRMENEEIAVFNITLSQSMSTQGRWYKFITDNIKQYILENNICKKRLILAGSLRGGQGQEEYLNMLHELELQDSSLDFCDQEKNCFTDSPVNEIYFKTDGDIKAKRNNRILLHKSALVYSSHRNMLEKEKINNLKHKYIDLNFLPPTKSYGWLSSVLLARCR